MPQNEKESSQGIRDSNTTPISKKPDRTEASDVWPAP